MRLAAALSVACATLLATPRGHADPVDVPTPPPVIYLVEAIGEHNTHDLGVADVTTGKTTPILDDLPTGISQELAVDGATRRWAFTFHQLANGDPLFLDGKVLTEPSGVHAVIAGQLDTPGITVLAGDPACHSKKRACFETPLFFAAGGQVLVTRSEGSSWWTWNRRVVGPDARPVSIVDKKLADAGHTLAVGTDGKRAAYQGKRAGLFVTAWPALATALKPAKVKAARARVAAPPLVMSDVALIGDLIFYFRRNPDDQSGLIAAWDLARKTEIEVFRFPDGAPTWHHRFLHAPARGSVIFQHDAAYERADVYEVSLTTWQVKKIGADVRELLDISPDGRFVLAAAYAEPDPARRKVFDQYLVILDVQLGREIARMAMPARLPRIHDARFVAPTAAR